MTEREQTIRDNLPYLGWLIDHRMSELLVRRWGGREEILADLYESYIKAVDAWLASDRSFKLGTYIQKACFCYVNSYVGYMRLINVPPFNRKDSRETRQRKIRFLNMPYLALHLTGYRDVRVGNAYEVWPESDKPSRDVVLKAMDCLDEKRYDIILWHYGLDDQPTETQQVIANRLGISKQRVEQLHRKALERLLEASERELEDEYCD